MHIGRRVGIRMWNDRDIVFFRITFHSTIFISWMIFFFFFKLWVFSTLSCLMRPRVASRTKIKELSSNAFRSHCKLFRIKLVFVWNKCKFFSIFQMISVRDMCPFFQFFFDFGLLFFSNRVLGWPWDWSPYSAYMVYQLSVCLDRWIVVCVREASTPWIQQRMQPNGKSISFTLQNIVNS